MTPKYTYTSMARTVYTSLATIGTAVNVTLIFLFSSSNYTEVAPPYDSLDIRIEQVLNAKQIYESEGTLEAMVLYGNAIDSASFVMKSVRDSLENKFFKTLAIDAGNRYNVPWRLLYGIWKQESQMNPSAKGDGRKDKNGKIIPGSHRAFGLGQVHLKSAREHYDSSVTVARLMNPIENGYASAAILRDYLKTFKGDVDYGVSAYNAGPYTVNPFYKQKKMPPNYWNYTRFVLGYALKVDSES